jgi:hypothetical protein
MTPEKERELLGLIEQMKKDFHSLFEGEAKVSSLWKLAHEINGKLDGFYSSLDNRIKVLESRVLNG